MLFIVFFFFRLNYHIIHNKTDKKPGLFAAAFAFVMLVGGFLLINYLPRITLGMLLLYAGLPLLEDNLIFSYKRVTKKEFVAIWVIVLVNAITGALSRTSGTKSRRLAFSVLSVFGFWFNLQVCGHRTLF